MSTRGRQGPEDTNETAFRVLRELTGECEPVEPESVKAKSGRLGGLKGGNARKVALTPERRKEIASKAAEARWAKKRSEQA